MGEQQQHLMTPQRAVIASLQQEGWVRLGSLDGMGVQSVKGFTAPIAQHVRFLCYTQQQTLPHNPLVACG
jgi:hypothetical protein